MSDVILVDMGVLQSYIFLNIDNLKAFGNTNITLIADPHLIAHVEHLAPDVAIVSTSDLDSFDFDALNRLSTGFWANTSKRLFYVYSYMKQFGKTNCIHLENDYLIYFEGAELLGHTKLLLTMDREDERARCIPGFLFIPDASYMQGLIETYDHTTNDMVNMARFYFDNPATCEALNIVPSRSPRSVMLFDAAAIGQYLGGIDPNNNGGVIQPGYVSPDCMVDYSVYSFRWIREASGLYVPSVRLDGINVKIHGLHVHSKALANFQGTSPKETRLITFEHVGTV